MKPIAIDTETFLISRENPFPKNVCTTWCDGDNCGILHHTETEEQLEEWILDDSVLFVGLNVAYDFCSLCNSYPEFFWPIFEIYKNGRVTDVGIRQQLFDIAIGRIWPDAKVSRYSLSWLYEVVFQKKPPNFESKIKDNPDSWRTKYGTLYNTALDDWPEDAIDYAIQDAIITYEIYDEQTEAEDYFRDDTFQAYASFCLAWIQNNGIYTSPDKVAQFEKTQQKIYFDIGKNLEKYGLVEFNKKKNSYIKKRKPTQKRIFEACKKLERTPLFTPKGKEILRKQNEKDTPYPLQFFSDLGFDPLQFIATDKSACVWSEDHILAERIKMCEAEKMISTYVPPLKEGFDLPITCRFDLAATGRTTCSEPREPLIGTNLQNQPKEGGVRECFIPRKRHLFLGADFSGAELHTLAEACYQLVGYSTLGDALNKGLDVHLAVAAKIEDITYEEALFLKNKKDKKILKSRFYAKMANFGFGGGMGARTWVLNKLKDGLIIDITFGEQLKRFWLDTWLEMREYFNLTSKLLRQGGGEYTSENLFSGRLRYVDRYTVLNNDRFQSLAADGAKKAICEVIRRCYCEEDSSLYSCLPVNFVHDELMLEIPDTDCLEYRDAIVNEFIETMSDEFNAVVPHYPTTVDAVLMDCWKKCEPLIDADGHHRVNREK